MGIHSLTEQTVRNKLNRDGCRPALRSALGNELATLSQAHGMAAMAAVCYADAGQWKVSLRSLGAIDTTRI